MTCIIGVSTGTEVWIGGDSAGTAGYSQTIRADAKVFTNGPMVLGFTSSFRMGQLLRHSLIVPKQYANDNTNSFMCTTFIDAVRKCLKNGGYARNVSGEERGGCFLVGYKGALYRVDCDYQVAQSVLAYDAVGCGDEFALGRLFRNQGTPEERITDALDAAAYFSAGVAPPFTIVSGGVA